MMWFALVSARLAKEDPYKCIVFLQILRFRALGFGG